ncbi:DgyrCDS14827 [Dimorphilus gyrociliatus]|uniref:DgyrCDS14827 n=1 Tax=Dimorphilus gyrociliatus TaxID=2664684 RepID=A0A7I8WFE2_9ANNE|nr:DgyrCDS14827 [Dimorphilus gyrociliatus]
MAENEYICTLEEKYIKKARDELNEIPSDRLSAVKALRDWVNEQEHLTFDTRTFSLLRILRHSKFSQSKARYTIEKVACFYSKNRNSFSNLDSRSDVVQEVLRRGHLMVLPGYDDDGRVIMLYKLNMIPFEELKKKYRFSEFMKVMNVVFVSLMKDEMFQVNGIVLLFDMTGINLKIMTLFNDPDSVDYQKDGQDAQIGRIKGIHYYNVGSLFETIFSIYKPFMKKKHKERTHVHGTLESLYKHIPKRMLPREYLPDDYDGPICGSLLEIGAQTADRVLMMRDDILDISNPAHLSYNESKKPATEVLQHFRKLNVD